MLADHVGARNPQPSHTVVATDDKISSDVEAIEHAPVDDELGTRGIQPCLRFVATRSDRPEGLR